MKQKVRVGAVALLSALVIAFGAVPANAATAGGWTNFSSSYTSVNGCHLHGTMSGSWSKGRTATESEVSGCLGSVRVELWATAGGGLYFDSFGAWGTTYSAVSHGPYWSDSRYRPWKP